MALLPSADVIVASVIFGLVGLVAFRNGRRNGQWRMAVIGVALMLYPYFISNAWAFYAVGIALCAALYLWRE